MGPDAWLLFSFPRNDCNAITQGLVIGTDQQQHLCLRGARLPDQCGNPNSRESMSFRIMLQSLIHTRA